ncbi:hypothetical protein ECSTECEH250_1646 [Escherichia coli STEC_EH250]|nr:hypothetical protein ECSTECEH250_1646 [Escherichia coli STEC_EH250]
MEKYKRILLRLTMKNGLELKAPVTDDISRALAFAIKWVAVGISLCLRCCMGWQNWSLR